MKALTLTYKHRLRMIGLFLVLFLFLLSACGTQTAAPMEAATPSPPMTTAAAESTSAPVNRVAGTTAESISAAAASRTPVPTPTPGAFDQRIEDFAEAAGLTGNTFLGLTIDDWIDVAFSALIVIVGYLVGTRLVARLPQWINQHTSINLNKFVLKDIGGNLKWLVLLFFVNFAITRLEFLSDRFRTFLDDAIFVLGLVIVTMIALKLVNSTVQQYIDSLDPKVDRKRLTPILIMAQRLGDLLVLIVAISFGLSHFGININALSAVLIVLGLILSFSAQDSITDMISGFIILIDHPFRVGDTIFIKELDTWGDILEIGNRTTRIQTGNNRTVIVPNSQLVQNQVVNYTYPDPSYRVKTDIGVAYGSDADKVRRVIVAAVRGIEGVLPDKNVDVHYLEFGDSARKVRVHWWVGNYHDEQAILNKVNIAIETALDQAGIKLPLNTYDLNVKMEKESADE